MTDKERIAELEAEVSNLKGTLEYQTEARVLDSKDNSANFAAWKKTHHDHLSAEITRLKDRLRDVSRQLEFVTLQPIRTVLAGDISDDTMRRWMRDKQYLLRPSLDGERWVVIYLDFNSPVCSGGTPYEAVRAAMRKELATSPSSPQS